MINNLLLRMKLSNEDPEVRLGALDKIPSSEQEFFYEIAIGDADPAVRREAIHRLDDHDLLEKTWEHETDPDVKQFIRDKLNRRYLSLLSEGKSVELQFLKRIDDEMLLVTAACSTPNPEITEQLSSLIHSGNGLVKLLRNLDNYELALKLLDRLGDDKELWMELAETAVNTRLREYVRDKMIAEPPENDSQESAEVSEGDAHTGIGNALKEKLHSYENIIDEVKRLTGYIGADASERLQALRAQWETLPEVSPGFMEVLKLEFDQACRKFEEGIETTRKQQEERLLRIDQLDALCAEAARLLADASTPLKKEQLAKLRRNWENAAEGLTAIEPLQERFDKACGELEARLEESRKVLSECLARLEEIVTELETQAGQEEPDISRERRIELEKEVEELMAKASGHHQANVLRDRFYSLNKNLRQKIHEIHQVRDLARWENYALKIVLCEQAEKLLENTDLREVGRIFKEIRHRWKDIGMVPHEKIEEINSRFHQTADELNRRCTEFFDALNKHRDEIAVAKEALCAEAETLQQSTSWNPTAERFKEMQKQWRELGSARHDVENALLQRFRASCDIFFNARRTFLDELNQQRTEAVAAKKALCDEAQALLESYPAELNRQSKQLWDRWREAGSAGREDHKLYETFKAIFDSYHDQRRHEREDHLDRKKQLCLELKEILSSPEASKISTLRKRLDEIQYQWDRVGQIPREYEKELRHEYDQTLRAVQKMLEELHSQHDVELLDFQQQFCKIVCAMMADSDTAAARQAVEQLGDIPAELNALSHVFRNTAEAIENGDRDYLSGFAAYQDDVLQEMKRICADFERLNGIETKFEATAITDMLADLNAALQNNIASTTPVARNKDREAHELRDLWFRAGVPPLPEIDAIFDRYRTAVKVNNA